MRSFREPGMVNLRMYTPFSSVTKALKAVQWTYAFNLIEWKSELKDKKPKCCCLRNHIELKSMNDIISFFEIKTTWGLEGCQNNREKVAQKSEWTLLNATLWANYSPSNSFLLILCFTKKINPIKRSHIVSLLTFGVMWTMSELILFSSLVYFLNSSIACEFKQSSKQAKVCKEGSQARLAPKAS